MSVSLIGMLVGSHFRPPSNAILALLPAQQSLVLEPEADNPYDEAAVKVLLPIDSLPPEAPQWDLSGTGYEMIDLIEQGEPIHLGYLAAAGNRKLKQRQLQGERVVSNVEFLSAVDPGPAGWPLPASLLFAADGQALVSIKLLVDIQQSAHPMFQQPE